MGKLTREGMLEAQVEVLRYHLRMIELNPETLSIEDWAAAGLKGAEEVEEMWRNTQND